MEGRVRAGRIVNTGKISKQEHIERKEQRGKRW
jgi:hypothetical protein